MQSTNNESENMNTIPCQFQEAPPVAAVSIMERKRIVRAYPGGDSLMDGLCAHLTRCVNAPYYCDLRNETSASGFYPEARTLAGAREEVRAHMRKYQAWDTARLYDSHGGNKGELRATFRNRKAGL
jgi:hypothetical protein